jgi:hypothetical protein
LQTPTRRYNYSWIVSEILRKHKVKVSIPTVIKRAKIWGYYKYRNKGKQVHDKIIDSRPLSQLKVKKEV